MRKLPTGEPYAGKPPVRFGGRGGVTPFPTPIGNLGCYGTSLYPPASVTRMEGLAASFSTFWRSR